MASVPRRRLRARGHEVLIAPLARGRAGQRRAAHQLGRRHHHQRQCRQRDRRASGARGPDQAAVVRGRPAQRRSCARGGLYRRHLGRRQRARSGAAAGHATAPTLGRRCSMSPARTAPAISSANSRARHRRGDGGRLSRRNRAVSAGVDRGAQGWGGWTRCCIIPGAAPRAISKAPRPRVSPSAALAVRHVCLSAQIAAPLIAAGAADVAVASAPR